MSKTLILVRGASGSGKSTVASHLKFSLEYQGTVAGPYEADQWMMENGVYKFDPKKLHYAHTSCRNAVEDAMKKNIGTVIVSNTFIKKWEMQNYLDLAKQYGYAVQEIIVRSDFKNTHGVPDEKVAEMKSKFEF